MAEISRRTFLGAASGVVGGTALGAGWTAESSAAWAEGEQQPSPGSVHKAIARDATMVWKRVPEHWQTGPFLGNGFLGVQVYKHPKQGNVLKVVLSHTEVQDQREYWEAAIGLSRLPIGYLTLTFAGSITEVDWELDLWNAELTGIVTTATGSVKFSALVHNDSSVLLFSLTPSPGEEAAAWAFQWLESATPRPTRKPPEYVPNPPPTLGTSGPTNYCEQPMLAGGGYTTAWQEKRVGTKRMLAAAIAYSFPATTSTADAVNSVQRALSVVPDELVRTHRAWWHHFYTRSLVSVPDKWVQRFYWIQLYKMASTTRQNAPVVAEWGAWYPETGNGWTAVWWNLNVQAAYPMVNGSNHPELDAVTATFREYHKNLELSVPPAYRDGETYALSHPGDRTLRPGGIRTVGIPGPGNANDQTGNLIWGMHNVWLGYRHSMDTSVLRDVLYPILAKAVNYYLKFLTEGPDGRLHLPQTRSPEYANATDATYDLSLIRWGCTTLLESAELLSIDDPRAPRWKDTLARLVPYHTDPAAGVMIGDGVPLADSHRHYSHLLWLYPLREARWDNQADRELMRRTFDHWISNRQRWHGYSLAAASSMCSVMDSPEEALSFLRYFLDGNVIDNCQMTPNTMYREGGNFAIESPFTAAQSVLDMLVQSDHGVVKVFPSVSSTWADAAFDRLRTQGAFVIDASRSSGSTDWIRIRSEAGEPLVLEHGIKGDIAVLNSRGWPLDWKEVAPGRIAVRLTRGNTAIVKRRGTRPILQPRDVAANGTAPPWGLPT